MIMLDKKLEKIKIIGIEKFHNTKTFIATDDKLPDGITLENITILMMCLIKDDNKLNLQLFLEA